MTAIDDLVSAVEALPVASDGSITLAASDFDDFGVVQQFLADVVGQQSYTIDGAKRTTGSDGQSVTITGTADVLGYVKATAAVTFAYTDAPQPSDATTPAPAAGVGLTVTLTGTLTADKPQALPIVSWIEVTDISVATTIAEPYAIVTKGFSASVVLEGDTSGSIPITLTPAGNGGDWTLAIAGGPNQSITAEQLVGLLGGPTLEDLLPSQLTALLEGLQLADLAATFNPTTKTVDLLHVGVTATNGWPLAGDFALDPGLHIGLSVRNPADAATRDVSVVVTGTFAVGPQGSAVDVPVFVSVDVAGGTSTWVVGLDPATSGVTLPSLSNLLTLAGADESALPGALAHLPGIQLNPLLVTFTLSPSALVAVTFGATTTESWHVIDNFLTVDQIALSIDVGALQGTTRPIGGSLSALLSLGADVGLYFASTRDAKTGDWTISGGLTPGKTVDLTTLVAQWLDGYVTIPASAPDVVIDSAALTVVPGKTMSFKATSTTTWPVLEKLQLDSITLAVNYDAGGTPAFTGAFGAQLTLAGAQLDVSAALDKTGTWAFHGGTAKGAKLSVTTLINDLTSTFGVPEIPADALGGLTLSNLSIDYSTGDQAGQPSNFHFGCEGTFAIADSEIDITVDVALAKSTKPPSQNTPTQTSYTGTFDGQLKIATAGQTTEQIGVTFKDDTLVAGWTASPGHELSLSDVAAALGFDVPEIPSAIDLTLKSLAFTYNVKDSGLALTAETIGGSSAVLATALVPGDGTRRVALGVDLKLGVKLSDLPLVGDKIPDADQLGVPDLGFWVVSGDLAGTGDKSDAATLNALIVAADKNAPTLPQAPVAAGVLLFGTLQLGADSIPLTLEPGAPAPADAKADAPAKATPGTAVATTNANTNTPAPAAAAASSATTKWFTVQRTFGVFTFARVGVQYDGSGPGTLFFLLDASIEVGPVSFTTQGLGLGSPLDTFDPTFHLDGLGLSYDQPPLLIAGGLLRVPDAQLAKGVKWQFDGFAVVKAAAFSLGAVGSYAQLTDGDASLFLFAELGAPLGGPPAFFVTGLMGGFGYNRSITMPAQDQVLDFPLLALGGDQKPADVLGELEAKHWIDPQPGEYWLAAGIEFTSFELLDTKALLIAQFGQDLAFALLGISTLTLPKGATADTTYAYVELELAAVLKPTEGVFGLTAVLGPASYVIAPACHLTGGFAFFVWFGDNPNAGQFVVTLGGYHPAFQPPDFFPTEPRLGFSWAVSDEVAVKGGAYFALTTSSVMAGGSLEITFQSGNLRAWFTAQMDVLIAWHPFSFQAEIGVSIGVSYKLDLGFISKTIEVSLGASVALWGPPTGGTVTVHLWVVSFTVDIGAPQSGASNTALTPTQFAPLLPAPDTIVTTNATGGLTKVLDDGTWAVRPSAFAFATGTAIPSTALDYGQAGGAENLSFALEVRPMNINKSAAVPSTHTVALTPKGATRPLDLSTWAPAAAKRSVPCALWGAPQTDSENRFTQLPQQAVAETVDDAPVGAAFTCPAPTLGPTPGTLPESTLDYEPVSAPNADAIATQTPLAVGATPSSAGQPTASTQTLAQIAQIAGATATGARTPVWTALGTATALGTPLYTGPEDSLSGLAGMVDDVFAAQPMMVGAPS